MDENITESERISYVAKHNHSIKKTDLKFDKIFKDKRSSLIDLELNVDSENII